ncbi:MAG: transposase [bacterium]|nr:transposase [bacterium]
MSRISYQNRRSIRFTGYDYSKPGAYFITICSQSRDSIFGVIENENMTSNEAGLMITKWWYEIPNKFPSVKIDGYIVMPNHFHGIITISPDHSEPDIKPVTLGNIVGWFKTMTTNEYIRNVRDNNWPPFEKRLWQRNYYEHIIRDEKELNKYREYIRDNPLKWDENEDNI